MIINDKLNGLIVLDLEWREVNRIYIGEQLLPIGSNLHRCGGEIELYLS